jgi:hypothetical protein
MNRAIGGVLAVALLSGCAGQTDGVEWSRRDDPSSVRVDLALDVHVCERWSQVGRGRIDEAGFRRCMVALGWQPRGESLPSSDQIAQQR